MLERLTAQTIAQRTRRGRSLLANAPSPPNAGALALSTFCVDLLPPLLAEALERAGRPAASVAVGPFGQVAQELLAPDSGLYRQAPDMLVLVLAVEDLLEPLFTRAPSELDASEIGALVSSRVEELRGWLGVALGRLPEMTCYVTLVGPATAPLEHVLSPLAPERARDAIVRLGEEVRGLAQLDGRIVVVDWEWHVRSLGTGALGDPRLWYLARMRLNPAGLAVLAELVARHVAANDGSARKVAAVDLDGVMWGGVVGEVGLKGIELGGEGVGLAFQDFQRELLRLRDVGVLLALCSKNNPADVHEVFSHHPAMVVRREHFAAERVNWRDKATNLRELAHELSLGLDSFVFLDDSPFEREWVRGALPQVIVPELASDPAERPGALRTTIHFQRILSTEADLQRASAYQLERHRRDLAASAVSFDEFLSQLQQRVTIEPVSDASLARAAQLCQRTNQFNLTTRRYRTAQLEAMLGRTDTELYTLSVCDRFGDSGITGLAILRIDGCTAEIDTLLMSCRVLGRRLEDALLAFLAERAETRGSRLLIGRFHPTAKNGQVADFYIKRRFEPLDADSFQLDLARRRPAMPAGVKVSVPVDA
jgi:FkbH-like protein